MIPGTIVVILAIVFTSNTRAVIVPGLYEIRSAYKTGLGFTGENISPSPDPPPALPPVISDLTGYNVSSTWTVSAGSSGKTNVFVLRNLEKTIARPQGDQVILEKFPTSATPFEWLLTADTLRGPDYYAITAYDGSGVSWFMSANTSDRFGYVLAKQVFFPPAFSTSWQFTLVG
ncbi:hypothetical protein DL96DRAFT_1706512 [Flagelloscypha sp. PMI_526]|nr:hypothetical protein DL96DRAFT_1706512 [Flagelloscypha sp. PMI_526]